MKHCQLHHLLIFLLSFFYFSTPAFSAKFANQFTEFELPPQWQCNLEGAEWVCQSANESKKKDAIIVLAAKLKGEQDTLDQYLTYLKAAKTYTSIQGKSVKSESKYAKNVNLNGQAWVDALHLESEIPGFYTRYLATVKQDIGVLITYSVNKAKYQQYLDEFDNMVKTLKVFRKSGGINVAPQSSNLFQNAQIPTQVGTETIFPSGSIQGGADSIASIEPSSPSDSFFFIVIISVIIGMIGFIVWKRKNNH